MGSRIATIRGVPVNKNDALTTVKQISGVIGLGFLAQQLAIGAYKTGLPFLGGFMSIPLVFGLTYGIGRVMDAYFQSRAKGLLLDPDELKDIWKRARKEGKAAADKDSAKKFEKEFSNSEKTANFIKTNFDEILILASLQSIRSGFSDTEVDQAVLAAFQRYSPQTQDIEGVQAYLEDLSEEQIAGVVSNVKGILHEMEFVRIENSDGDSVTAAMFPKANHEGFDVVMNDSSTGETWEIQLKTTDNKEYVQEWLDKYPDGEILVSEELASEMNLDSSGFSNEEITVRVEDFVDQAISMGVNSNIWVLFSTLTLLSVSLVLIELFNRYKRGEISEKEFRQMAIKATGIKAGKIALLMTLLSIPVINVVVGAGLVAQLLYALTSFQIAKPLKELSKLDYLNTLQNLQKN